MVLLDGLPHRVLLLLCESNKLKSEGWMFGICLKIWKSIIQPLQATPTWFYDMSKCSPNGKH